MITIRPGSHVHTLLTVLSFVGEYPVTALGLLGSVRSYKDLIHKLTMPQESRFPDSEERFTCRLLTVSGKGKHKTIRLHKSALPLLKCWDEDVYDNYMYEDYELNKIRFTRLTGAIVYPGGAYAVYNYREEMLKWMGEGEVKIKHHLHTIFTPMMSYEFPLREAAIIFGADYDVALNMLKEMKETQKMDNGLFHTYKDIFFIPRDDFGARLLRVLTTWNWQERILNALFDPKVRSYNRGSFTYDAHENGEFQFSFLDGNIRWLFHFREAIMNRDLRCRVMCYHEQVEFVQKYLADFVSLRTGKIHTAESWLEIKLVSLLPEK